MWEPLTIAALIFGGAGFLLGLYEFRRRERLLSRMRPWQRHAITVARMGEEYLRNADNVRAAQDEADRTVQEMITAARDLAESMRRAGVEFTAKGRD